MFMIIKQVSIYDLEGDLSNNELYTFVRNEGVLGIKRKYIQELDNSQLRKYFNF